MTWTCSKCGEDNSYGQTWCGGCGAWVVKSEPEPSGWVWHDIETAPKDGETILLMQGRNRICCTGRWSEQHNHWATGPGPMASLAEVTHWTSLKEAVEYWDRQHTPNDRGKQ